MGFFDELDEEDIIRQTSDAIDDDIRQSQEGNVGDVCYYDLISNEFGIASTVDSTKLDACMMQDWRYLTMGIIINLHEEDKTVDVLMSGFLMKEPLTIPLSYASKDKQPYIRAYAYDMFKRYVKAFFKQLPGYEALSHLEITMPTVSDMLKILEHSPQIFTTLRMLTKEPERFEEYYKRIFDGYIFVRHTNGRIYEMALSKEPNHQPDVIIPTAFVRGDFMCVFRHVDAFNQKKMEEILNDKDNNIFFK